TEEELVLRYRVEETDDGFEGEEGTFTICSFWLVSALVEIGEVDRARSLCTKLLTAASRLRLFAEEIDPHTGHHLGNFPQAFSHLALINAVMHVIEADDLTGRYLLPGLPPSGPPGTWGTASRSSPPPGRTWTTIASGRTPPPGWRRKERPPGRGRGISSSVGCATSDSTSATRRPLPPASPVATRWPSTSPFHRPPSRSPSTPSSRSACRPGVGSCSRSRSGRIFTVPRPSTGSWSPR